MINKSKFDERDKYYQQTNIKIAILKFQSWKYKNIVFITVFKYKSVTFWDSFKLIFATKYTKFVDSLFDKTVELIEIINSMKKSLFRS